MAKGFCALLVLPPCCCGGTVIICFSIANGSDLLLSPPPNRFKRMRRWVVRSITITCVCVCVRVCVTKGSLPVSKLFGLDTEHAVHVCPNSVGETNRPAQYQSIWLSNTRFLHKVQARTTCTCIPQRALLLFQKSNICAIFADRKYLGGEGKKNAATGKKDYLYREKVGALIEILLHIPLDFRSHSSGQVPSVHVG